MSQLDPICYLYVKSIARLFPQASGLNKNPSKGFPNFTGRVNKLGYGTLKSLFPI